MKKSNFKGYQAVVVHLCCWFVFLFVFSLFNHLFQSVCRHLRDKGEDDKMPPIRKRQRGLLLRLQQEKVTDAF